MSKTYIVKLKRQKKKKNYSSNTSLYSVISSVQVINKSSTILVDRFSSFIILISLISIIVEYLSSNFSLAISMAFLLAVSLV